MYKIFIIEDDFLIAEIFKNKIAAEGYIVEVAHDAETAFPKLESFNPDLLLLDMMLPGLSGNDLLKILRAEARFEKLPIVVFTGSESYEDLEDARLSGATRVMSKTEFTPSQIVARITELLALYVPPRHKDVILQTLAEWESSEGRVLVVEDDPIVMALVKEIIEEEDFKVVAAANGHEAYNILSSDNNFVGCIFDVNVPLVAGTELVRHMKNENRLKDIPVMMMTSDQSLDVQSRSLSAGARIFISKPFTRASLKTMFRTIVDEKRNN